MRLLGLGIHRILLAGQMAAAAKPIYAALAETGCSIASSLNKAVRELRSGEHRDATIIPTAVCVR
jgi:hypothetical protein